MKLLVSFLAIFCLVASAEHESGAPGRPVEQAPPPRQKTIVGYHETGVITGGGRQILETRGLNPCVGVVIVSTNARGERVAVMLHFAPQFLGNGHSTQGHDRHLQITRELLTEGLDKLKEAGGDPARARALLSGKEDPGELPWGMLSVPQQNARDVLAVLGERNLPVARRLYHPQAAFRGLTYDLAADRYTVFVHHVESKTPEGYRGEELATGTLAN